MGFETAVLYRKYGLRELELHRYELVFPESITPLDSLGAIIIYGEYPDGEGGCSKGTVIYPIDDYTYYNLSSNHREVNRQYYPTEQLRQSNAIKKNDSTHKA